MELPSREKDRIKNKYGPWAVVTGASSGIGEEIARRLGECEVNVLLTARRVPLIEKLSLYLKNTFGIETKVLGADLATSEGIQRLITIADDLDIGLLVSSAGFGTSGLFYQSSEHDEQEMLRLNCEAVTLLSQYFARRFAERGSGGMIFLSSIVAFQGVPYAAHYAATKAYIQTLAEGLAMELKPMGVDVLSVAPGPVHTGFAERSNMQMGKALNPADIGVPILKALGRTSMVFPGLLTKLLTGSLSILPRYLKVRVMKLVMGGMTQHQRTKTSIVS